MQLTKWPNKQINTNLITLYNNSLSIDDTHRGYHSNTSRYVGYVLMPFAKSPHNICNESLHPSKLFAGYRPLHEISTVFVVEYVIYFHIFVECLYLHGGNVLVQLSDCPIFNDVTLKYMGTIKHHTKVQIMWIFYAICLMYIGSFTPDITKQCLEGSIFLRLYEGNYLT